MKDIKVGIIDYGIGNQISIKRGLSLLGIKSIVSNKIDELNICNAILLPGVGAFAPSMKLLKEKSLDIFIQKKAKQNFPIIGICLGMQLLFEKSYENGEHDGLGILPGIVECLSKEKLFHIGWNNLKILKKNNFLKNENHYYYFNHSYGIKEIKPYTISTSHFNNIEFSSVIKKDKIIGIQFHPEKSQENGKKLFKDLLREIVDA